MPRLAVLKVTIGLVALVAILVLLRVGGIALPRAANPHEPATPPGPVGAVLTSPGPGLPAPGYASGDVLLIDGGLLYLHTDQGDRVVRSAGASIWKGGAASLLDIEVGDIVTASGTALADGTIDARTIDVNIVQVRGVVVRVDGSGYFVAQDNFGHEQTLRIDAGRPPAEVLAAGKALQPGQPITMVAGQAFMAIGLRLRDGSIRVTRLFL